MSNSHDTTVTPPLPTIGLVLENGPGHHQEDIMGDVEAITPLEAL